MGRFTRKDNEMPAGYEKKPYVPNKEKFVPNKERFVPNKEKFKGNTEKAKEKENDQPKANPQ